MTQNHISPGQDCTINPIVIDDSKRSAKNPVYPFDKWQKENCGLCQVSQRVCICDQIKYNFREYQKGALNLKNACPMREDP